ncbi:UNVERIFIED_CONTAM: putative F-box/FBD/LRR-repeat protein [Sesamum latifolium]|uniref:F-box/FBD/LRR-repeat protein n=1 Tax=Sesamum latifolium TaxID=2727402 RepID=A0AAW2X6V5_9LAMI
MFSELSETPKKMKIHCNLNSKTLENKYEEDKISSLPEPILHYILSYLPTKDAVKTSALSKTWKATWKSFPILDFNQYSFQESAYSRTAHKNHSELIQDFCDYVDEFLTSREGLASIEKFQVVVNFQGCRLRYHRNLDRWLNYAIENNVEDLVLAYHTRATTKGGHWLSQVYIDQETLQGIVSSSCLLEELCIRFCKGFQVVRIAGPKLESVDLYLGRDQVQIVAVAAPNLRSLSYGGGSASVRGCLQASEQYENLKELRLHDTDITDDFFQVIPEFQGLDKLEVNRCCLLERIRISSVQILDLCICDCARLKEIELDTRRLSRFKYDGYDVDTQGL